MAVTLTSSLVLTLVAILGVAEAGNPCRPSTGYSLFTSVSESTTKPGQTIYTVDIPGSRSEVTLTMDFNEYFALNATSRDVSVKGNIDAETMEGLITIIIKCKEVVAQFETVLQLFVTIVNENDNSPEFTSGVYTIDIGEMAVVSSVLNTPVSATDADELGDVFYRLLPGPYSGYFLMSNRDASLTLVKPLDYEELPTFNITVVARNTDPGVSGSELNATCVLQIVVLDEDDQFPVFTSDVYQAFVSDTSALNSAVSVRPAIAAFDPDTSINSKIIYSFRERKDQSGDVLTIDPDTAEVTLTSKPASREIVLLLEATQTDNPMRYGLALLTLQVQGQNVYAPVFSRDVIQLMRTEAFPVGEIICTILASDADPGSTITYSIDEASMSKFTINENTGDMTLISRLDSAEKSQHVIAVTASDGELESSGQITIQVLPTNNKPPVILTSADDLNVSIPRRTGMRVADICARDDDVGVTVLSYKLLTYSNLFAIDYQGRITVAASEAELTKDVYQVAVIVQDDGQPRYSTATAVTVNFPTLDSPVVAAQMAESDSILPLTTGIVAAVFLAAIIVLVVYIVKRRLRDKEHLDRAKKQQPSQDAKALAFKKQGTLGKQARVNIEFGEDPSDGDTTVQVETSVSPYANVPARNDDNNNDNIYNHSQMSEESEDYPPSDKQAITSFFRNGTSSAVAFVNPSYTYQDSSVSGMGGNTSLRDIHDIKAHTQ